MNTAAKNRSELERYAALLEEARAIKGISLGRDAWRRLRRIPSAMFSLGFLIALGLLAVLTPLLPLQAPRQMGTRERETGTGIRINKFAQPTFWPLFIEVPNLTQNEKEQPDGAAETGETATRDPFDRHFGKLDPFSRMLLALRLKIFGTWSLNSICGTDLLGRDILSRLFWGARVSLAVGLVATFVSLVIGVSYGAVSGYLGGRADNIMMRLVDIMYSIPFIVVVIFLITVLSAETEKEIKRFVLAPTTEMSEKKGLVPEDLRTEFKEHKVELSDKAAVKWDKPEDRWEITDGNRTYVIRNLRKGLTVFAVRTGRFLEASRIVIFFVLVGAIYWLTMARVVRGQVISLKNDQFVEAARTIGAGRSRIIFLHLVPNLLSVVIVYLTLTIPRVMLFEAFLSFLGLGVEPPDVSWGLLANQGVQAITAVRIYWWLVVFPGLALGLTLWALNFLGDGLRDALDPRLKNR